MYEALPAMPARQVIAGLMRLAPGGVWLDNNHDTPALNRYSFAGVDPFLVFSASRGLCVITGSGMQETIRADPWPTIQELLRRYAAPEGPFPLACGGTLGYLGYDMGRYLERLPDLGRSDAGLPEVYLGFYDLLVVMDHLTHEAWLVSAGRPGGNGESDRQMRMIQLREYLTQAAEIPVRAAGFAAVPGLHGFFTRNTYGDAVRRCKEYIAAGDIYEVNLSQRFWFDFAGEPIELYVRLSQTSPAPFGAFLRVGDAAILCRSPERFLQVQGANVETRPIKGTRPRGNTPENDRRLAEELLASEKDRAELMMVVDLERNDLSRVCLLGTVKVPRLCGLESYANVHHLVATVTGTLKAGLGVIDLLKAAFPGGSITGVPKIRAMEIIEELEPVRRGIYTGSLGYLGFDGSADLNIIIRTAWIRRGKLFFQVGGAVTFDSDPVSEYEETLHKATAVLGGFGLTSLKEVFAHGIIMD